MAALNPWRELRAHPEVTLEWRFLPDDLDGLYCPNGDGTATIIIDANLGRTERNVTLCHELVHHRFGITGVERLDERGVEDEVARLLVPVDELAQLVASICDDGTPVMAWEVAEAFDVTDEVAERACRLLRCLRPGLAAS